MATELKRRQIKNGERVGERDVCVLRTDSAPHSFSLIILCTKEWKLQGGREAQTYREDL
jgi:hypothetical protein